ncbi:hypothetical protein OAF83_00095 [Rubripirellula sp.]|nr:hypothetical protein [Rubripirellula sp.]
MRIQNRIHGETVQRQADVFSIVTTTTKLESRISRVERMLLSSRSYPSISAREAKAALNLALAEQNELLNQPTKPSEVQIAAVLLAVTRAESRLTTTLAIQKETMLLCQLDVIEAELEFLQLSKKVEMQQRLVARGLKTSEPLAQQKMAVAAAQKKLELMRLRQETQQTLQGGSNAKLEGGASQPSDSSATP